MSELAWRQEYSVNIKVLDDQHRQLIETINVLNNIIYEEKDKAHLAEVFDHLMEYVTVHFTTEERLMAEHDFPGYQTHKEEHEQCGQEVVKYKKQYEQGEKKIAVTLIIFLTDWPHRHLLETDKQYSAFLNKRGVF
jgi:hemerythrin